MIKKEEVYKIGKFNKPHGIHGEISFSFTDDIFDRVDYPFLICLVEGILVPFPVEEYRFKGEETALIKLEHVDNAEDAKEFTNMEVFFPKKYAEEQEMLSWHFFVGFEMQNEQGVRIGTITEVDETTSNRLFIVDNNQDELLIPAHEEWILGVDTEQKILTVSLPEGLIDMNE